MGAGLECLPRWALLRDRVAPVAIVLSSLILVTLWLGVHGCGCEGLEGVSMKGNFRSFWMSQGNFLVYLGAFRKG